MFIDLSKELTRELGKGFSRSNLFAMRNFHLRFLIPDVVLTVSGQQSKTQKRLTTSAKAKTVLTLSGQGKKASKPAGLTVSHQLSWAHYYDLLKCNNEMEIGFYQQTAINEGWSVRELRWQMNTALFERITLSKNAKNVMKLAAKGQIIESETDITKDPYVLEFLNIPEHHSYTEKHLE